MSDHAPRLLVLSAAPFPAATGAATRLAQRIATLSDAGYALDVLTPKTPELPHVSKLMGARILRVPMPTGREPPHRLGTIPPGMLFFHELTGAPSLASRFAAFERAIRRQLASTEYDVIVTFDPYSAPGVLEQKGGARLVYEAPAGLPGDGDEVLATELRRRDRELLRGADVVIAATEELAARARGLGAERDRIHVAWPSVDLDLFLPPLGRRRRPPGEPVRLVVSAAQLSGLEAALLVDTLGRLPARLDLRLVVSAQLAEADRARLVDSPFASSISVVEPVLYEDLPPLYQAADIGLVVCAGPERGDLPPVRLQAMAEMMASALPLVAPDLPATRELVDDRKHALLVPPADPDALAAAIRTLASQPARRRVMGQAARARASERLDERRQSAKLLSILGGSMTSSIEISHAAFLEPSASGVATLTPSATNPEGPTRQVTNPFANEPSIASRVGPRPSLASAASAAEPDAPTAPDMNIHGRALADLASAATTDPSSFRPKS